MSLSHTHAILDALREVLDEGQAQEFVRHRNSRPTKKPFDLYRARLSIKILKEAEDTTAKFWELVRSPWNDEGELSVEYVRAVFEYDPVTGIIYRRSTGEIATYLHPAGYLGICVGKKLYLAHRLAWLYVTGHWPSDQLDHINRNRVDNRFCNLRECTNQQNAWNAERSRGVSGVRGVHWDSHRRSWMATIRVHGKTRYLGRFKKKEEAASAYRAAEMEHRGEFLEAL